MNEILEKALLDDDMGIDLSKDNYAYKYKANRFKGVGGSWRVHGKRISKYPYNLTTRLTPEAYEEGVKVVAQDLNVSESEAIRILLNKALGL